jgi:hypothetical protein
MISSVFYRSVVEYFRELCPVIRKIEDITKFDDSKGHKNSICRYFYNPEDKMTNGDTNKKYLIACRKQERKKMAAKEEFTVTLEDMRSLKKLAQGIPSFSPDTDIHEISIIDEQLYSQKDLEIWNKMAKDNGYDLKDEIKLFLTKLLKMIQLTNLLK